MNRHEQFAEGLALHAMGSLQGEERTALEKHLEECNACRRELEQLRGDLGLLAASVYGPKAPARAKQRLMAAIAREPRQVRPKRRARWWISLQWGTAAAAVIIVALLMRQDSQLRWRVAELQKQSVDQQQTLSEVRQIVTTLTAQEAARFTLVSANTLPQPQGKAIYLRRTGGLIFLANNLPILPPQKAYELWLIPTSGAPIPAGLFKPDARGSATVVNPPLPQGADAKTFAITVEPETGSAAPTSQPIMVGVGG